MSYIYNSKIIGMNHTQSADMNAAFEICLFLFFMHQFIYFQRAYNVHALDLDMCTVYNMRKYDQKLCHNIYIHIGLMNYFYC